MQQSLFHRLDEATDTKPAALCRLYLPIKITAGVREGVLVVGGGGEGGVSMGEENDLDDPAVLLLICRLVVKGHGHCLACLRHHTA